MAKKSVNVQMFSANVLSQAKAVTDESKEQSKIHRPDATKRLMSAVRTSARSARSVTFGSATTVGKVRTHNEDSLFVAPPLYVVADGMGGHRAGEVASELAVQTISQLAPGYPNAPMLEAAVEEANLAVYDMACNNVKRKGMGTTVTAALLQDARLVIAQVGDSRAYLLHHGTLQQLTRDHSLMQDLIDAGEITAEQARIHPQRNYITRALGTAPTVQVDTYDLNVSPGDRLLLCTDGLSGMVNDHDLADTLSAVADPQKCVDALIRQANEAGGHDNITAIVVDVAKSAADTAADAREKRESITTAVVIGVVAVALVVLAGVLIHFVLTM